MLLVLSLVLSHAYQTSDSIMSSPVKLVMKQLEPTSDNKKSIKRVNGVQKQELVRLLKANFLFIERKHAVVRGEQSRAEVWRMITARLNSLGPPMHSIEVWQKVSIFGSSCYCALKSSVCDVYVPFIYSDGTICDPLPSKRCT